MLKKNDHCKLRIDDLGNTGEGIGKFEGFTFFVEHGLPGDYCEIKILKMKKNYGFGKLVKIISPSKHRITPPCEIANKCGGCSLLHMDYDGQLQYKHKKVVDSLERIGSFKEIAPLVNPVLKMDLPFRYRNKIQVPVKSEKGHIITGYYTKMSHVIVPSKDCLLQPEMANDIMNVIKEYMALNHIKAYDESTHSGKIRHILIRFGKNHSEVMVCLIVNEKNGFRLKNENMLIDALTENPNIKSMCINYNRQQTNVILGDTVRVLFGREFIYDTIGDIQFQISPLSFFQVNPLQTKVLYEQIIAMAQISPSDTVLDIYCGIGSISLYIAKFAYHVYGIELVPQAIKDAVNNAALNDIENTTFFAGKAEEVIFQLMKDEDFKPEIVIVDPPRKGCDHHLLEALCQIKPNKIIYVSCNPDTLARDLKYLCSEKYDLDRIQPVDMFPHAMHVETVALLTRKKDIETIDIEMKVDKEDITEKATYKKI